MIVPDSTRRELLKRCGALGLATLGGCACPWPSLPVGEIPPLLAGAMPPPPPKYGSLDLPIVIDAHCHIFNVEDVPASPFLKGPAAHYLKDFPAKLIRALADVVSAIAWLLAPSARAEMRMLEEQSAKRRELSPTQPPRAASNLIQDMLDEQRQKFSRAFSAAAQNPRFAEPYKEQLELYSQKIGDRGALQAGEDSLSEAQIYKILTESHRFIPVHGAALDPQQLVRFAFTLTSPRFLNLAIMQRTYSGGGGSPAIDVFCPSLLDLNHWLGCKETASSQDDQVRLLEQIAIMSGGAILPFVAYNPQSDIEQHDESFERVVTAIASRGFIGVKLYPPMGYLAYGNACEVRPGTCPMPENAKDIDKKLCRLYEWCVDQNVPIMSHTSHSFGATDADDDCASPFGWQRALETFAGLRVQAGHFGGESQYALDEKWAAQYVQMMGMRNARNLYVDLSNLGALFVPDSEVRKVIEPLFSMRLSAGSTEIAADRMLYGGDWYLTQLSNMCDVYVREMNLYLERIEGEKKIHGLRKSVFGQNAVKLYGLTPGPARGKATNWNRLKAYYVDKGISTPTWMCKLEASCEPARQ